MRQLERFETIHLEGTKQREKEKERKKEIERKGEREREKAQTIRFQKLASAFISQSKSAGFD